VKPLIIHRLRRASPGVEKRAVRDRPLAAGAREVLPHRGAPWRPPSAAGLPVTDPSGHMVVDIGGAHRGVAVNLARGHRRREIDPRRGRQDGTRRSRVHQAQYHLLVGSATAEINQKTIRQTPLRDRRCPTMEIKGRDLVDGRAQDARHEHDYGPLALSRSPSTRSSRRAVVPERTPPELAADSFDRCIVLTGGVRAAAQPRRQKKCLRARPASRHCVLSPRSPRAGPAARSMTRSAAGSGQCVAPPRLGRSWPLGW